MGKGTIAYFCLYTNRLMLKIDIKRQMKNILVRGRTWITTEKK